MARLSDARNRKRETTSGLINSFATHEGHKTSEWIDQPLQRMRVQGAARSVGVLSCSIYAPIRDWGPENRSCIAGELTRWCQGSHRCLSVQHQYFVCLIVVLKPEITVSLFKGYLLSLRCVVS